MTWSYSVGVSDCSLKSVNKLQDKALLKPVSLSTCMLHHFSRVRLSATPWTVARQAPLSMGFSRHEYWSGLPCPPPKDLPDPGIEPGDLPNPGIGSPTLQLDFLPLSHRGSPNETVCNLKNKINSSVNLCDSTVIFPSLIVFLCNLPPVSLN